jgi:adenylate cyclase
MPSMGMPANKTIRREEILKAVSIISGISTLSYTLLFSFIDYENLRNLVIATFVFSILFLFTPYVQRISHIFALIYLVIMVGIGETTFNYIGGSDVSGHYFFLATPAIVVMTIGPKHWKLGAVIVLSFLFLFIYSEKILPPRADLATLSDELALASFLFCVIASGLINFVVAIYAFARLEIAEEALSAEHQRSENLLLNLVPASIAERLKRDPDKVIADYLPETTILFADIVNFTPFASQLSPQELVVFLNRIFSEFDFLCEKFGLEKIKTIGDAYMVAGGIPEPAPDAAQSVARMALEMLEVADRISSEFDTTIAIRIGIHKGPVVAGVIGSRKLFYDVWGDAVNTAARMESHGVPGKIQVTKSAMEAIGSGFTFQDNGRQNIKGKGQTRVYFLSGEA